jgi:hypothetical protein
MATTPVIKPGTLSTGVLSIKATGGSEQLFIKAQQFNLNLTQKVDEVTGDTDVSEQHEGSCLVGGTVGIVGLVRADQTEIGIEKMFSTTANEHKMAVKMGIASARFLNVNMVVRSLKIGWTRNAGRVGISIDGQVVDTLASAIETTT